MTTMVEEQTFQQFAEKYLFTVKDCKEVEMPPDWEWVTAEHVCHQVKLKSPILGKVKLKYASHPAHFDEGDVACHLWMLHTMLSPAACHSDEGDFLTSFGYEGKDVLSGLAAYRASQETLREYTAKWGVVVLNEFLDCVEA